MPKGPSKWFSLEDDFFLYYFQSFFYFSLDFFYYFYFLYFMDLYPASLNIEIFEMHVVYRILKGFSLSSR